MRRGIGNPWRNKPPNPAIYAEALGKKFKAWRTQFSLERGMDTIAQLPSIREKEITNWLDQRIDEAKADPPRQTALQTLKWQREFSKMEGAIDNAFYKRFLTWLMGKGQEGDHLKTPWYRQAQALELEEVRELLEAFLWEIHLVENQLLKLVWKGPQTLNEYYLYFKYVLQHQEFVLETDPWFFLEWRQYSRDNVVMDEHGKPSPYRGDIELAQRGREPPAPGAGEAIEVMRDFFAELQTLTQAEVEAKRKEVRDRSEARLRKKLQDDVAHQFSDDDEADIVDKAEPDIVDAFEKGFNELVNALNKSFDKPIEIYQQQLDQLRQATDALLEIAGMKKQAEPPDLTASPPLSPSASPPLSPSASPPLPVTPPLRRKLLTPLPRPGVRPPARSPVPTPPPMRGPPLELEPRPTSDVGGSSVIRTGTPGPTADDPEGRKSPPPEPKLQNTKQGRNADGTFGEVAIEDIEDPKEKELFLKKIDVIMQYSANILPFRDDVAKERYRKVLLRQPRSRIKELSEEAPF